MILSLFDLTIFGIILGIIGGGRVFIGQNIAKIQPVVAKNGSLKRVRGTNFIFVWHGNC